MSSKPGLWRVCRLAFRCARFLVWGAALLVLLAYAWFNVVGLPDFLKTRLVSALRERGVQLEFTRMRLRFVHGLVCDQVRIGPVQGAGGPVLRAREVQLRVNYAALLHLRAQVDGLVLRQGNFTFPLAANDALAMTNLQGELRILPDETWSLDRFRADLAGVTFTLAGEIAHAPECRNWKLFAAAETADHGNVESSLRGFADTLKQIHFAGNPQLNVRLNGDARDVQSIALTVSARAPGVETPWFSARNLEFAARVYAPTNAPLYSDPAWCFWTNLQPFRLDWLARGADVESAGLEVDLVESSGYWSAPELVLTELSARLGGGSLEAGAKLDVGARGLDVRVHSGFDLHAMAALLPAQARERLAQVSWTQPPTLQATGTLVLPAWTNRAFWQAVGGARAVSGKPQAESKKLVGGGQVVPGSAAGGRGWQEELWAGAHLHGAVAFTNTVVAGGAPFGSVQTHFTYANRVWSLPDLALTQGRTTLEMGGEENDATEDFNFVIGGKLDAESVRPFLATSNAAAGFKALQFREPVTLELELAGNLRDFATLAATGRVVATDFAIRGQTVDSITAALRYTNLTAEFFHPQMARANGTERFAAEKVTLDLAGQRIFLHGGTGHVSPVAVGKAIGPQTAAAMEPYHFLDLPNATVEGCIPLKQRAGELVTDDADLRVDVIGTTPFRWRKFETPRITGTIHWLAHDLILTNVVSECYGGTAQGWGVFDVETPGDGTDFSFYIEGTNVDFNAMGRALWSPTNQLKGALSGQVLVTSANSSSWRTWNGYGQAQLHSGLLWDAPILGLMSPVLNTLTPGLDIGNSRATDGAGRFNMTNGIVYTDSLEIRSLTMRLDYVGTVDLDENVAARARAQLLRNTPMVGPIFSLVLTPVSKAFECEVTGTLDQPKITPVYIPFAKVFAAPLHPIRTIEKIFAPPATNNPVP